MSAPQVAALPPELNLWAGCIVRVTALDATTGTTVAGVVVADVSLEVANLTGAADSQLAFGPFQLVPGPIT